MQRDHELEISVRVTTRCSRNEILGFTDGQLKIRTSAAPVDGKANQDLIRQLAREFGAPPSRISLVRGGTSRNKVFRISGVRKLPPYMS